MFFKTKVSFLFAITGKLWVAEPEMTWRQEMPVPSSEESKIALQTRLELSPSKYIIYIKYFLFEIKYIYVLVRRPIRFCNIIDFREMCTPLTDYYK